MTNIRLEALHKLETAERAYKEAVAEKFYAKGGRVFFGDPDLTGMPLSMSRVWIMQVPDPEAVAASLNVVIEGVRADAISAAAKAVREAKREVDELYK